MQNIEFEDLKELDGYRPWTEEEVPIGAVIGVWYANTDSAHTWEGRLSGVETEGWDVYEYRGRTHLLSTWTNGDVLMVEMHIPGMPHPLQLLRIGELLEKGSLQFRVWQGNHWLPCGVKK